MRPRGRAREDVSVLGLAGPAGRASEQRILTTPFQEKPVIIVEQFTVASGVELPYDMKMLQTRLAAELKIELKEFTVVSEQPSSKEGARYTLEGEIEGWRPGNAAKRLLVGFGSGREASDIAFRLKDGSGRPLIDRN